MTVRSALNEAAIERDEALTGENGGDDGGKFEKFSLSCCHTARTKRPKRGHAYRFH